ncbi:MAG: BTAD domain-containing putative transcriptional regulator [Gemmatimonadota bacterium]
MMERSPDDPRLHFALANEYEKLQDWDAVIGELTAYLESADDQGNAWGRLGRALHETGRDDEARQAYQRGIDAAQRHGHPSMAEEIREEVAELGG